MDMIFDGEALLRGERSLLSLEIIETMLIMTAARQANLGVTEAIFRPATRQSIREQLIQKCLERSAGKCVTEQGDAIVSWRVPLAAPAPKGRGRGTDWGPMFRSNGHAPNRTTLDRRRGREAAEPGAKILGRPNRYRDWPARNFRPHEGPRTVYLFANVSGPATGNQSRAP
jgi:hypothetical protein